MQSNLVTDTRSVDINLVLETGGGGSGRHVLDLHQELRNLGWNTHLILSNRRIDSSFAEEIAQLPPGDITFLNVRRSPHPSDLYAALKIRRLISKPGRRQILHAHSTKAAILASMIGGVAMARSLPRTHIAGWILPSQARPQSLSAQSNVFTVAASIK